MRYLAVLPLTAFLTVPALAQEADQLKGYYDSTISNWANDPVVVDALRQSNDMTAGRSEEEIETLDQQWRGEVGTGSTPSIDPVIQSEASEFLRQKVEEAGGDIKEISLIDANGFNAAISHVTTDYYQGDEGQFTEVYSESPGFVRVGEVEFDESSQSYQADLSFPVADPDTQEVLGTMTVSVDPEVSN